MDKATTPSTRKKRFLCMACIFTLSTLAVYTRCIQPKQDVQQVENQRNGLRSSLRVANPISSRNGIADSDEPRDLPTEYILLLGLDRSRGPIGRTDTILVVALNHQEKKIGVISVPRDLWVNIHYFGPGRINKVYRVGERFFGEGAGLALLQSVVEELFDIEISYVAAVNFAGFRWAVDTLRGVPVNVACPMEDCFWIDAEKTACTFLSLQAGRQVMGGETALLYARSRHGRSDMDRTRRQQAVLLGLWERLTEFGTLLMLPELFFELRRHITTTMRFSHIPPMLELARSIDANDLHGVVLGPPEVVPSRSDDGKFILLPDREKIAARLDNLFTAPLPGTRTRPRCVRKDAALNWRRTAGSIPSAPFH